MADRTEDLQRENESLRAEIQRLKGLQGGGGSPSLQIAMLKGLRDVLDAADELLGIGDWNHFYRRAVELAREQLGVERISLAILDLEGKTVRHKFGTDVRGRTTDEREHSYPVPALYLELVRDVAAGRARWRISDSAPQLEWADGQMREVGDGWVAVSPVHAGGKLLGILCNDNAISRCPPDAVTQEFVLLYGSLLGNILRRRQAQEKERRTTAGLRATLGAADELIGITDREQLFRRAVEVARERLGLERVGISLLAEDGEHINPTFGTDFDGKTVDERGDTLPMG